MPQYRYLSPVDYVVFGALLVISSCIGIFFGCIRKPKTTETFLLGNRKMGVLPVSLSLLASFMSAITLLGTPSEVYVGGTQYVWIGFAYIFVILITTDVFLPVFYPLQLTTSYQYLGLRFHKSIQVIGATVFIVQMTTYMGIVLYAPSLALNAVTGLNVWISVCLVAVVCTFYTSIGGIKAVMWTDVFQIVIMFAGLAIIIIRGLMVAGGISRVFEISYNGSRLEWFNFDPNPTNRHTVWSLGVGAIFTWAGIYGINQAMVQRGVSSRSLTRAKIAFWINFPGLTALMLITSFCGLIVYAIYGQCDPVKAGMISKSDQLLPLFVMEHANFYGLPGLFVACLFSGALSTVSSGLNSLAAVTISDIIVCSCQEKMTRRAHMNLTKGLGVVYGLLCLALAYVASMMGQVLSAALGLFGMLSGPIFGVFSLGVWIPFANWKGAMVGYFIGQTLTFWTGFGFYSSGYKHPSKPIVTDGCVNISIPISNSTSPSENEVFAFYRVSYMWYSLIGFASAFLIGLLISAITGGEDEERRDPRYFTPMARVIFKKWLHKPYEVSSKHDPKWDDKIRGLGGSFPSVEMTHS